ncbi:MAG: antitoxin [Burkholderiales bacterium]|nr:antitoxin [Burkholderiales bacterium]
MNEIHQRPHVALLLAAVLAVGGLYGCKQEGPAETAGKKIDQAVEKTGDALEKAGEKTGDALEKAGDKIEDTVKGDKK